MSMDTHSQHTGLCQECSPPVYYGPAFKPSLPELPPIWAQSRQEVCESFDWFRSYQGGVYHARNAARGYLLGAFSAKYGLNRRDVFAHGGKLIISHGGGKAQSVHTHRGQSVTLEADDQLAQDKSVRALLANYRSRRPLVLLIDDKYALFPYDLQSRDITYAVLGFYTIVHAWAEYQSAENQRGRVIRYKFVFQWCESQGEPWWLEFNRTSDPHDAPKPHTGTDDDSDQPEWIDQRFSLLFARRRFEHIEKISNICVMCHEASPQVYKRAWTCLNSECPCFWLDVGGTPLGDELEYNPRFLELAPADSLAIPVDTLEPEWPLSRSEGRTTDYAYTRGWHCKKCGRLSCRLIIFSSLLMTLFRYKWEHWECMNCQEILPVEGRVREAREFLFLTPPVSYHQCFIARDSGIKLLKTIVFELRGFDGSSAQCFTYELPGSRGFIHHIRPSNPHWNWEADEIFREYQAQASTGALPFRRWPMRAVGRGALLTNYFSQNDLPSFRHTVTHRPQYVGGTENTLPFDKVPVAGNARNLIQKRIKQALGMDASFNEVLSAAYMERQKMAFHTDDEIGLGPLVAGLSLGSPALMHFRPLARQIPEGVQRSIAISFVLRHGDVLAMDGAGVQQFYEHTVVPSNFRIAATARFINPNHPK
ncbi:hypothetical protein AN958_03051 [Leucoagaricus sp. SymC.cos]|nr:hypothetical protein AN958_03051 [Leucoagaricus sp. SymC.cos]